MSATRPERSHEVCYYCKLAHRLVEASGVHHCPNPLCTGPGAATFRRKLNSYEDVPGKNRHTVDDAEMVAFGVKYAADCETTDPDLAAHITASIAKWETPQ